MKFCVSPNSVAQSLLTFIGVIAVVCLPQPSYAWQDMFMYPVTLSDTGPGSNPRIVETQLDRFLAQKSTTFSTSDGEDNRDADGIGDTWSQSESGNRIAEFYRLADLVPWIASSFSGMYDFSETSADQLAFGFIAHRYNDTTMGNYVTNIQGTLLPPVPSTFKVVGSKQIDEYITDETSGIDTYQKFVTQDIEFATWKTGYELFQAVHPEGIEWTRVEHYIGYDPDRYPAVLEPLSRTTTGFVSDPTLITEIYYPPIEEIDPTVMDADLFPGIDPVVEDPTLMDADLFPGVDPVVEDPTLMPLP